MLEGGGGEAQDLKVLQAWRALQVRLPKGGDHLERRCFFCLFVLFCFVFFCAAWLSGSYFPDQELNPGPGNESAES